MFKYQATREDGNVLRSLAVENIRDSISANTVMHERIKGWAEGQEYTVIKAYEDWIADVGD